MNQINGSTLSKLPSVSFSISACQQIAANQQQRQPTRAHVEPGTNGKRHAFSGLGWDRRNGNRVASGVYLYTLKAGEVTLQRKLVLMK